MIEDAELLRRYAEQHSEPAFAELVRRHVNFVYACALRRVGGDAHLAEDVTQRVFTAVAQQARALVRCEVLTGWLYTTARNAAAQVVRTERRRKQREQDAHLMNELTSGSAADAEWQRLRPVLDDAMDGLSDADRQAVLLRFYEGKSFADVGARLRLTENTARMRVERALGKLHGALASRGVTSTTAALGVALANQAAVAAPAGLAASVTGAALAAPAVGSGGWLVLFVSMNKLPLGIAGALAVAGAAAYGLLAESNAGLRREIGELREQQKTVVALQAENRRLAAVAAEVEMLRRDDGEFKRLAQAVAEQTKASQERARLARLQEAGLNTQAEIDRMNKEGNALVIEYKALAAQAKDPSLSPEAKTAAKAAAQLKLAAIQEKQREIRTFVEGARAAGQLPPSLNATDAERPMAGGENERTPAGEIDRLNRESKALVVEYKTLVGRSNDPALTDEARGEARAAAEAKMQAVQAKLREVREFTEKARAAGVLPPSADGTTEFRPSVPGEVGAVNPPR